MKDEKRSKSVHMWGTGARHSECRHMRMHSQDELTHTYIYTCKYKIHVHYLGQSDKACEAMSLVLQAKLSAENDPLQFDSRNVGLSTLSPEPTNELYRPIYWSRPETLLKYPHCISLPEFSLMNCNYPGSAAAAGAPATVCTSTSKISAMKLFQDNLGT